MPSSTDLEILQVLARGQNIHAYEICSILYPKKEPRGVYPFVHQRLKWLASRGYIARFEDHNKRFVKKVICAITPRGLNELLKTELHQAVHNNKDSEALLQKYAQRLADFTSFRLALQNEPSLNYSPWELCSYLLKSCEIYSAWTTDADDDYEMLQPKMENWESWEGEFNDWQSEVSQDAIRGFCKHLLSLLGKSVAFHQAGFGEDEDILDLIEPKPIDHLSQLTDEHVKSFLEVIRQKPAILEPLVKALRSSIRRDVLAIRRAEWMQMVLIGKETEQSAIDTAFLRAWTEKERASFDEMQRRRTEAGREAGYIHRL